MKSRTVRGIAAAIAASVLLAGCAPAAGPAGSKPAAKVDYPQKGKVIQFIQPSAAGGPSDVGFRLLMCYAEKELGVTIETVNKTGGGNQVGLKALADAKPDGYTIGAVALPNSIGLYLDKARDAGFNQASYAPIMMHVYDPGALAVKSESPYQSLKELVDASKANPNKIRVASGSKSGRQHLDMLTFQQMAGSQLAIVNVDSTDNPVAMLLGGHIDAVYESVGDFTSPLKAGQVRILGVADKQETARAPGAKTFEAQGFALNSGASRTIAAPAGTPKEVIDTLGAAFKKAFDDPEHQKKMEELGLPLRYMGPDELTTYWTDLEQATIKAMDLVK